MPWFTDRRIVSRLPPAFRIYAAYARLVGHHTTSAVKGGTALHRQLAWLTRRVGGPDTAMMDIDGLKCAVDLLDLRLTEVLFELTTPGHEVDALKSYLGAGDTFLDIGANHGTFALQLASVVGPTGQVIAFEPQPRLVDVIRRSMAANAFTFATVIETTCGDDDCDLTFFMPALSGGASFFRESAGTGACTTMTVRQCRLDDVMAGRPVHGRVAIKLDVEGAEVAVLRGAREFLRAHRPPMLIEMNQDSLGAAKQTEATLVSALQEAGYSSFAELPTWPVSAPLSGLRVTPQRNVFVLAS
jgi:FkbM family methyltransferase